MIGNTVVTRDNQGRRDEPGETTGCLQSGRGPDQGSTDNNHVQRLGADSNQLIVLGRSVMTLQHTLPVVDENRSEG